MCGIVAYIGEHNCSGLLVEGLKKLEYRGYDSAGIAVLDNDHGDLYLEKTAGSVDNLKIRDHIVGKIGLGHTRWATHGKPCKRNAHPHISFDNRLIIVHNGILENYKELKGYLENKYQFSSDTDSEVLLYVLYEALLTVNDLYEASKIAVEQIVGPYAFIAIDCKDGKNMVCARKGSPLVIGVDHPNYIVSSDVGVLNNNFNQVIYMKDNTICEISNKGIRSYCTVSNLNASYDIEKVYNHTYKIEKNGYDSFMMKEFYEQPEVIERCISGRIEGYNIKLGGLSEYSHVFKRNNSITIVGCGSSYNVACLGRYFIESISGIKVNVEYASEFRYRNPAVYKNDVVIGISQSGETADTIAALELAKHKGAIIVGICNTVNSTISRMTDCGMYTRCGIEVGVASTKSVVGQMLSLLLMSLWLEQNNNSINKQDRIDIVNSIKDLSTVLYQSIHSVNIDSVVDIVNKSEHCIFLGRGVGYPVAMEGALKLKELSYIHAEAYAAAEMKHGPLALIDDKMPVICVMNSAKHKGKIENNVIEIESRSGSVIRIDCVDSKNGILVPESSDIVSPFISLMPLQLISMRCAEAKGLSIDKPRNLAKSVTVE